MLTKIRIKNFKCLKDTGNLEIRPLTFLVGPNSSGKSSILQLLLMLRQTIDSTDFNNPLAPNNGWVKIGSYPDFIYKHDIEKELELNLEFTSPAKEHNKISLKSIFYYNPTTTQIILKESKTNFNEEYIYEITCHQKEDKKYSGYFSILKEGKNKEKKWNIKDIIPIKFYNYGIHMDRSKKQEDANKGIPPEELFKKIGFVIEMELKSFLFYLGPLRQFPNRYYGMSGQKPQDVGAKGERAIDVLWFSNKSEVEGIKKVNLEVQEWIKKFGFAKKMELSRIGKSNIFHVLIIDPVMGIEVNLADMGFGASQVIPIIIESFYARNDSIILIEQPEIHLHPKAQSILGDLFISACNNGKRHFIIETHSEHLLNRVRRRIAEGTIKKEDIVIYYFENTFNGTNIQEVKLNEKGQYYKFPKGFFEEGYNEAVEHLKAL
ncbi:MAG: AAA family ATPase [Atribacterota bacterium]|nr:AAA family ATPase [Atribacterota bacterium]